MSEFKNLPSGWKIVRLGEISSRVTRRNQDNRCQNVLTISAQSGLINQTDFFNKQVASKDLSNYILLKKGEFAYNKSYSTGYSFGAFKRLKFYDEGVASPLYIYFKFNDDVCSDFFEFYFDAGQANRQIKDIVQEGARNHGLLNLSIDDFFNIKIRMPNLDEQKKIAEILSTWDEAINLTINLIENKKQFKKALMQNLLTAKIRFPQFKDEWKETKLGEICDISTGTSKSRFIGDGKFYIVDMGSITQDGLLNLTKTTNLSQDFLDFGDLVMPKDDIGGGKIIGKVAVIDKDNTYVLSDHIFRIKTTENSNFLAYLINSDLINKKIRREVSGTAQLGLSKRTIENLKIKLPNLKEQQKIAEVLTACDDEINLLNLKLENLKKAKQGLRQKLLKGEIRTCYTKKTMQ